MLMHQFVERRTFMLKALEIPLIVYLTIFVSQPLKSVEVLFCGFPTMSMIFFSSTADTNIEVCLRSLQNFYQSGPTLTKNLLNS